DAVHAQAAVTRSQRDGERMLGQTVRGDEARVTEPGPGELRGEGLERGGLNRLGPATGHAPRREVEPVELGVLHASYAHLVGEVRGEADRTAMASDGLEPRGGSLQERRRRQKDATAAEVQGAQRQADEAHIVKQR